MADPKAIVNKLIEAEPDPDSPEAYLDWLGQKVDTGPLDKIRFGAYIYLTDEDTIRENAAEHGADVESQDFWDAIERDMAIIEANALRILREAGLHVSDEGHNESARVASVWIDTDDEDRRLALLKAVINWAEGDWPSTTSGTMDYAFGANTTGTLYANTSEIARFIDVTIEFTGTDALVEWSKLNLNEAVIGDPDDPEVFLRSYMPRMMGRVFIDFDVIKPHFPDAPTNWVRDKVNGLDLFRYNRVTEMREVLRQMKADYRQRGPNVPVDVVTYRYKLTNPQGSSIVRHWLDKIGCPPTVIQWACETNPPIWFFVSAKEFNAYLQMVYPQIKVEEGIDDPPVDLVNKLTPKVQCPNCGATAELGFGPEKIWTHPVACIRHDTDVSLPRYLHPADEMDPNVNIHHFDVKHIYKCLECGERFDGTLPGYAVESVEDEDDPEAFIRRFKPHWQLLSHLRNHHFYFIDDSGRVAVADYSMQNQKDPATGDDGLLILDKTKPITRYRGYLGKKMWNIFVTQYHKGVGDKPIPSGIGASEEEFADLWPKIEPLGFTQAIREEGEEDDPRAYLDAVTGWIDTFIKAGMTSDTSEGHEGQWWIKWRLGGVHVWIIVKVRRPIFMQILVNDALYGRNYMQRTFEFRQDYQNVDQKQLVQWFQILYRVINNAVKYDRNEPDIVPKLISKIEAYHTEFKQKQDRGRLGEAVEATAPEDDPDYYLRTTKIDLKRLIPELGFAQPQGPHNFGPNHYFYYGHDNNNDFSDRYTLTISYDPEDDYCIVCGWRRNEGSKCHAVRNVELRDFITKLRELLDNTYRADIDFSMKAALKHVHEALELPPEDDPTDALERFAKHTEQVEQDALDSAIDMAVGEFDARVRHGAVLRIKDADQLAAEIGDQYAQMAGYANGTDEYDMIVSAVNNRASELFPSPEPGEQLEAKAVQWTPERVREMVYNMFVQDGDITQKEAETFVSGFTQESAQQVYQLCVEINRNIIDDAKIAQLTGIAANLIRQSNAQYMATLQDITKDVKVDEAVDPDDPEAYLRSMETDWRKILRKYGWKPDPHGEHLHFTLEFPDLVWKRPVRVWATHGWAEPPEFHYEHPDPDDPDIDAEDAAYEEWRRQPGNDEFERIRNRDVAFPDYVVFQFDIESYRRIEVPVGKLENFCARFVREAKKIVGTETVAKVHAGQGLVQMLWEKAKEIARGLQIPLRESEEMGVPLPPEDEVDPKAYAMDLPQRMASYVKVDSNEEAEQRAVEDYEQAKGKVFKVPYLMAWRESDTIEVHGDFVVRVLATDIEDDILRWHDQYLDPVWEVEVLDGPPEDMALLKDTRSHYIDATSYTVTGKVPPLSEAETPPPTPEPEPEPSVDDPEAFVKSMDKSLLLPELERLGFTSRNERGKEWVYGDEIPRWWYKVYNEQTKHALYVYFWGGQTPEVQANVYDAKTRKWFKPGEAEGIISDATRAPAQSQAHLSAIVRDLDAAMQRMDPLNLPVAEQYATIKRVLEHHRKWWDDTLDYLINTQGGTLPGRMGPGQPA